METSPSNRPFKVKKAESKKKEKIQKKFNS